MKSLFVFFIAVIIFACPVQAQNPDTNVSRITVTTEILNNSLNRISIEFEKGDEIHEFSVESLSKKDSSVQRLKKMIVQAKNNIDLLKMDSLKKAKLPLTDLIKQFKEALTLFIEHNQEILDDYKVSVDVLDLIFSAIKENYSSEEDIFNYEKIKKNNKKYIKNFEKNIAWARTLLE